MTSDKSQSQVSRKPGKTTILPCLSPGSSESETRGLTATELAYYAGFFDGEGCIMLTGKSGIRLAVSNTHLPTLREMHKLFGGSVRQCKRYGDIDRNLFQWYAGGVGAQRVLFLIRPYLFQKRRQASVALQFYRGVETFWHADGAQTARERMYAEKHTEYSA